MIEARMIPEIEVEELARRLATGESTVVLDVREPWEREVCRLEGSLDIALAELPGHLDRLPRQGMLVVLCHHGVRSWQATQWLRQRGFDNAVNLCGGIDAWTQRIDQAMGTY